MVLHVLLASKLPFLHLFRLSPLLWTFNLCLPLARQLPRVCATLSTAASLFVLRLRLVAAAERRAAERFERSLRLVSEQLRFRPSGAARSDTRAEYIVPAFFALSL